MYKKSIAVLKGTSGTGKGTRVSILLRFLETKFEGKEVTFLFNERVVPIGIYFKDLNLLIVGKWVNSKNRVAWTSLDYINSTTGKTDITLGILNRYSRADISLLMEGEPMLLSNKYRIGWMKDYFNCDRFLFNYFNYDKREEYDERILARSGKLAGTGGWGRNGNYFSDYNKNLSEINSSNILGKIYFDKYNISISVFGCRYLKFIGLENLIDKYLDFCEKVVKEDKLV